MLTGFDSLGRKNKCKIAFSIKEDKRELHKIIFKSIISVSKLNHAYVYHDTTFIFATLEAEKA